MIVMLDLAAQPLDLGAAAFGGRAHHAGIDRRGGSTRFENVRRWAWNARPERARCRNAAGEEQGMRGLWTTLALAVIAAALAPLHDARAGFEIPVERTRLTNGLTVLVHEDRSAPVVSVYLFYRSGSRNERPGQTGIAHLFEHMMFNGGEHTEGKFDEVIENNGGSTNGYTM